MARRQLYRNEAGQFVAGRVNARTVSAEAVKNAWRAVTSIIPARVAVAMAQHESSFATNEHDIEDSGFISDGIFQLTAARLAAGELGDAAKAGRPEADLFTLEDSCFLLAYNLEKNLREIVRVATDAFQRGLGKNPLDEMGQPIWDVWAYVAVSHNIGMGDESNPNPGGKGVLPGIVHNGLSWPDAFQRSHPSMVAQLAYGSDALTGGEQWNPAWDAEELPVADDGTPLSAESSGDNRLLMLAVLAFGLLFFLVGKG